MKVSVVVTNFNHKAFLQEAIRSVQNQTYDDIEILVVDDASTDGSQNLINEIVRDDKRNNIKFPVRPIFLKENKGKWNALNVAISEASGNLITLCDADDASCNQRIERQVSALKMTNSFHNLCGFFHCYSQKDVDDNKAFVIDKPVEKADIMEPREVLQLVHKGYNTNGINHYYTGNFETHGATCLFYKQLWQYGMKFMPGDMGLRCQLAEDGDFNTKMTLLLQKTSVLKEKLYCYRRNTSTNAAYLEAL